MRLSILIGGKAGQGINKLSSIVSFLLVHHGYYIFNYRDYQNLIRGGNSYNILSISDEKIGSIEQKVDIIVALDERTLTTHSLLLKKNGIIISYEPFKDLGKNLNIALAGVLIKILGFDKHELIDSIKKEFGNEAVQAAERGFNSIEKKFEFKKISQKVSILSGSQAIAQGAINSGINIYFGYPMTPSTSVLHELASKQLKHNYLVFQPENEIAVINAALGASYSGAKVMIGTSGGGFDLMTEGVSLQGQTEIPLVIYLASRPGPATGVPTYSLQADLDLALRGGHGEFPRVVIAPGDPIECIEKTNECFYFSQKFNVLSILLGDKHLGESEFSYEIKRKPNKIIPILVKRDVPGGNKIVKVNSYEHDEFGNTTEDASIVKKNCENRLRKYELIQKESQKFEMIKLYGNPNADILIIGWGSTKSVILDALDSIDKSIKNRKGSYKFLQVLYMNPLSNKIKVEIQKAKKIILIENNLTGQLGRLIREKTGIAIKNRILKYDARPFYSDELKMEILKL